MARSTQASIRCSERQPSTKRPQAHDDGHAHSQDTGEKRITSESPDSPSQAIATLDISHVERDSDPEARGKEKGSEQKSVQPSSTKKMYVSTILALYLAALGAAAPSPFHGSGCATDVSVDGRVIFTMTQPDCPALKEYCTHCNGFVQDSSPSLLPPI
ncbi:hypothetical protein F4861DRAFT_546307 [Xylaria intraflava]|nr:hypothetical protein F4861DRAFT_546307 [Xylaria intraflava]